MCVIIELPAKVSLPKKLLANCYDNNPDGWGIMWADGQQVNTVKAVAGFESFYKELRQIPLTANRAIHFRWTTHGETDDINCHPFPVAEDAGKTKLSLMHNGVIQVPLFEEDKSDTYNFVKYFLSPMANNNDINSVDFIKKLEAVTKGSKLLFMDSAGQYYKTYPDMWHKEHGCWFSNAHSLVAPVKRVQPSLPCSTFDGYSYGTSGFNSYYDKYLKKWGDNKSNVIPLESLDDDAELPADVETDEEISMYVLEDTVSTMSETEKFNWVIANPELATDLLQHLLD